MLHAKNLTADNFSSLSMLDHNRAYYEVASKLGVDIHDVHDIIVWGNHGESMVADLTQATFTKDGKTQKVVDVLDHDYVFDTFFKKIGHRAWDILEHRGFTSAASPTKASIQHMKAWLFGTAPGEVLSMGIPVPEDNPYGIKPGQVRADLISSNSVIFKNTGEYLSKWAKPTVKVLVIGNPDNTNCEIAMLHAKNLKPENFSSLSMLDHNRAYYEVASKLGVDIHDVHLSLIHI